MVVNPRARAVEPRVRKRRPKQYPLMKKPRAELHKVLREQGLGCITDSQVGMLTR